MDSETREIIDHFLTESREAVAEVDPLLMELEAEGGTPDRAAIDTIFRLFHSMKGSAGFLEFKHIEGVTHHAETLLDRIRTDDLTLSVEVVDLLCRAIDFTNEALDCVEATAADAEMAEVSAKLIAVITQLAAKDRSSEEASATDSSTEVLHGFVLPGEVAEAPLASEPQTGGEVQHETSGMVAIFDQPMPLSLIHI